MKKINRRDFIKISGTATAALAAAPYVSCGKSSRKPNIIYILADDLGYGDPGCYGQQRIKTPHLDQMAAEGIRFTQHYAGSTVCAPSRCCLMTGIHTGHARIRGNAAVPLAPEDKTIAEYLKEAGYTTGLIGKWGLGGEGSTGIPNRKGFDYFFGYLSQIRAHNYYPDWLWRNEEKVELKNEVVFSPDGYAKGVGQASTNRAEYSHDLFTQEALDFVKRNSEQPFFLYLAYTIPHANNEAHLVDRHGMEVPDYGEYADLDWDDAQKGHAAMISLMDRDIGSLFEKLKQLGIDEDTIVMFSSDNGPHEEGGFDPELNDSNGKLRGIKRDLYEGGIRVPFVVRWPGKIKSGVVSDHVSAFWDVLPTCADLAGIDESVNTDGISMVPEFVGKSEEQKQHDYLYWEFHWWNPSKQAVRMGDWKGVRLSPDGLCELYDLKKDPEEKNNIADQHPDIVVQMEQIMSSARAESGHWQLKSE